MSATAPRNKFVLRKNADATFDSICLTCYRTAASSLTENGLLSLQAAHACDPVDLWHAQHVTRARMTAAAGLAV